ncbi:MAG: RNA polymerase sigma factor [Bacteroidia bacterium]|nr:RNA polymerase sigma factor [Bacteroidia bacterium]
MSDSLIEGLKAGEEKAFRQLVENWQDRVYNTCWGFLRNDEDAEDMAQEVFMEVYRSVGKFEAQAQIGTWLYRIAVNKSLELIRSRKRKKRFAFLLSFSSDTPFTEPHSTDHPGVILENRERAGLLFQAMEKLPESQRTAFTLHKVEGLSYVEVGEIMHQSVSSVESLMVRAKKNLQKYLADYYQKK